MSKYPVGQHTPGPWHILCRIYDTKTESHRRTIAGDSRPGDYGGKVATAGGADLPEEVVEANARLIAAAPEMLSELRNLLRIFDRDAILPNLETRASGEGVRVFVMHRTAERVRELVAKAEGKS